MAWSSPDRQVGAIEDWPVVGIGTVTAAAAAVGIAGADAAAAAAAGVVGVVGGTVDS